MLSIAEVGTDATQYYVSLVSPAQEYYVGHDQAAGTWIGAGASELGLVGAVEPEAFSSVLSGFRPATGEKLVQNAGASSRRPGLDLTMSAPKSVSVFYSQSDEPTRREVLDCQQRAVERTLMYIQTNLSVTRRGKSGGQMERAGLVAAVFCHGISRELDPQLHSHCIVANAALRNDGTYGALDLRPLYKNKMTLGALYRAELAHQLELGLGFEIVRTGAFFDIAGIPSSLTEAFSTRRHQIEAKLNEKGLSGAKASAIATLSTRKSKEHTGEDVLYARWQETGVAHGFGPLQAEALVNSANLRPKHIDSLDVLSEALDRITAHSSTFTASELRRRVAEVSPGRGIGINTVNDVTNQYLSSSDAVIVRSGAEPLYSTVEMLRLESELLQTALRMREHSSHGLSTRIVNNVLEHFEHLNGEQRSAVTHVVGSGNIHVISGMAGSGKSTTCRAIRTAFECEGYTVLGAALSARAASALQDGAGIESQTLHSLLACIANSGSHLTDKTLLVVDEAGLVGTTHMAQLLTCVEQSRCRLILVGDAQQLQSIDAGNPFSALGQLLGEAELKNIQRQNEGWARQAVTDVAGGNAAAALTAYAEHNLVHLSSDSTSAMADLVELWTKTGLINPNSTLVIAPTISEVRLLNRMCQTARLEAGHLGTQEVQSSHTRFHVNDHVMFTRNDRLVGVTNGTMGTVIAIDPRSALVTVTTDRGRTVTICLTSYPHLELGYAMTVYKSQGQTAEQALVLVGADMADRELSYVALSRSRGETHLFIDASQAGPNLADLLRQMSASHQKHLAIEELAPLSLGAFSRELAMGGLSQ